jgi:hypothetical protein
MIRGLGALPDPHWACGTHCPEELCGVAPFPLDVDWSPLCAPVLDQGASQSCTGHAWANALCQVMRAKDANAERPSALLLYDMGRGLVGPLVKLLSPPVSHRSLSSLGTNPGSSSTYTPMSTRGRSRRPGSKRILL